MSDCSNLALLCFTSDVIIAMAGFWLVNVFIDKYDCYDGYE